LTVQASPPAAAAYDPARAESRSGSEPFKENPAIRIRQSAATSQLNPNLGKAYQSFLSGDTGAAQQLYHKVLQQEPNNRDALLGMAAIALKHRQSGQAAAYYGKLIELDPADPEALAGLIGLQGQSDPAQSESRLKKVLIQNPQADAALFALGNLYTQQSRWAEAQQSYFRAYSSAHGNADYAFNLAVSLDHLNQGKLALEYYQRALAQSGPTNFDKSSVQTRIKELLQPAGN
jgi:tetratricopeptide (TPR) repeat protein